MQSRTFSLHLLMLSTAFAIGMEQPVDIGSGHPLPNPVNVQHADISLVRTEAVNAQTLTMPVSNIAYQTVTTTTSIKHNYKASDPELSFYENTIAAARDGYYQTVSNVTAQLIFMALGVTGSYLINKLFTTKQNEPDIVGHNNKFFVAANSIAILDKKEKALEKLEKATQECAGNDCTTLREDYYLAKKEYLKQLAAFIQKDHTAAPAA